MSLCLPTMTTMAGRTARPSGLRRSGLWSWGVAQAQPPAVASAPGPDPACSRPQTESFRARARLKDQGRQAAQKSAIGRIRQRPQAQNLLATEERMRQAGCR
jgi:hypothetical protein